jgi:anti-sigma regulatory factor (Ser/Thr protein kinase)
MEPAADTHPRACAPAPPGLHQPGQPARNLPDAATAPGYARTFPGRADQVSQVRRQIAAYLDNCPAADDIVLIADELAANAILHTRSRGGTFAVRCHATPGQTRIEVEDLGGPWRPRDPGDRPHGLDIIQALTGPDGWGTQVTGTGTRIVWARLTW